MQLKNKIILGVVLVVLAVLVIASHVIKGGKLVEPVLGSQSYGTPTTSDYIYYSSDVVGTHVGTSTVGATVNATTTYVSRIGGNKNIANYTILVTAINSSSNNLNVLVQGSSDYGCDTVDTSTPGAINQNNINWFSAGDHMKGKVSATSFSNVSSTAILSWTNAIAGVGQEMVLNDLNYECLRLSVWGSSTTEYIGLRTK